MKTFVANGPVAIDIYDFKFTINEKTDISGSFSVSHKECGGDQIDINENLCIVSGKGIITGIEVNFDKYDGEDHSIYNFTGTNVKVY